MLKIISSILLVLSFVGCGETSPSLPSGYTLPPMPDETENSATIAGIDSNNNGIRDDVEIYIYINYSKPKEQRSQIQYAKNFQYSLIKINTKEDIYNWYPTLAKAIDCNIKIFGWKREPLVDIETKTLNTIERVKKNLIIDKLMSGGVYEDKKVENPCE